MKVLDGKPKALWKKIIGYIGGIFWIGYDGFFYCILHTFTDGDVMCQICRAPDNNNHPNLEFSRFFSFASVYFIFVEIDGEVSGAAPEDLTVNMDSPEEEEQKNLYLFQVSILRPVLGLTVVQ